MSGEETAIVAEFGAEVLSYRAVEPAAVGSMYERAIASTPGERGRYFTIYGNAICGQALLAAFRTTGRAEYRDAAVDLAHRPVGRGRA